MPLRPEPAVSGPGCSDGFLPVEPYGHVCSEDVATSDADARVQRLRKLAPRPGPHPFQYAISNGTPVYGRLPEPAVWLEREKHLDEPGSFKSLKWQWRHERLARERLLQPTTNDPSLPAWLRPSPQSFAPQGVLLAFSEVFEQHARTWLLTASGSAVPADRVRPFERSEYAGLDLTGATSLPLVWSKQPTQLWRKTASGFEPAEGVPRHSALLLADEVAGDHRQTQLRSPDGEALWVQLDERVGLAEPMRRPSFVPSSERWIGVSVSQGVLVAYEGDAPVFTTLISPGRGGLSHKGRSNAENVQASTTPVGGFRIQHKYWVHTMSPDKPKPPSQWKQWIEQVQFAQFFDVPFALHSTYWHDDFGQWMSNGCVNLSPRDAQRLFEWTSPNVPSGWGGIYQDPLHGQGTWVVIRR